MYLIYWKSTITGFIGHDTHPMTKELAEAWLQYAVDLGYPLVNWLVQV